MNTRESIILAVQSIAPDIYEMRKEYCIIGSAALFLSGMEVPVNDLDILASAVCAMELEKRWQRHRDKLYVPDDPARFRSVFGRYRFNGLPIEVMGDLDVQAPGGWERVAANHTVEVNLEGITLRIPQLAEQKRILHLLGRPKDFAKIKLIEAFEHQQAL